MTTPAVLLTLDEARDLLGSSAMALVEAVACSTRRLARLLAGQGSTRGLPALARDAVRAHRAALGQVLDAGHGWILDEQVEGALAYADCTERPAERGIAA
jgi:hypothetical protein